MKTRYAMMGLWLALLLAATPVLATSPKGEAAPPSPQMAEKIDFDDVVVQTLSRTPTNMDTIGIISRKRQNNPLYRRQDDLGGRLRSSLGELGDRL